MPELPALVENRPAAPVANASRRRIAVLIPCYNEELTISAVVADFRKALPGARIVVFDNNSTDRTAEVARAAGAQVLVEKRQGKGYVVQSMFNRVDADIYIMVDGDGTYPAAVVRALIDPIANDEADMVIGSRLHQGSRSAFRSLNRFGNHFFLFVLRRIFKVNITDLLSGYRGFSRRMVRGTPLFGGGFETEAEMTIKAVQRGFRVIEVPVDLTERPTGSESKIRVVRDGMLILKTMLALFRDYKPLSFFGALGLLLIAIAMIPGVAVVREYIHTGSVLRIPSAILATGLVIVGGLTGMVGLILHTIAQRFRDVDHHLQMLASLVRHDDEPK